MKISKEVLEKLADGLAPEYCGYKEHETIIVAMAGELLSLRGDRQLLIDMCDQFAMWLVNVHIDYRNGNVAPDGSDEGEVLGRRGHRQLLHEYNKLMGRAEDYEDYFECDFFGEET